MKLNARRVFVSRTTGCTTLSTPGLGSGQLEPEPEPEPSIVGVSTGSARPSLARIAMLLSLARQANTPANTGPAMAHLGSRGRRNTSFQPMGQAGKPLSVGVVPFLYKTLWVI